MSDPLSHTLAAITLATALKGMIELAQKLNNSFKQVRRDEYIFKAAELMQSFAACSQ